MVFLFISHVLLLPGLKPKWQWTLINTLQNLKIKKKLILLDEKTPLIKDNNLTISVFLFVGVPGFEPGTSCSQSRRANRTALHPELEF